MVAACALAAEPIDATRARPGRLLSARNVGEYAAVPWVKRGTPIAPGSREDRVRDLDLSVASVNLTDEMSDSFLQMWREYARNGREQHKAFLPRLHFWDGDDRYQGPLRDIEVYWKRLDTFLAAMDLNDFTGIVLAEENIHYAGRPEVLRELYRRVKEKYDVDVWQWWSPMRSVPSTAGWIPADGWVIDLYFMPRPEFRRMVRKYLISGVPLVVMPWAAHMDPATTLTESQWAANRAQLETAVEFNLPVAFFWILGTGVHFGGSRGEPASEIDRLNHWVWEHIARVRALPNDFDGFDSADLGTGDVHEIGPTEGDRLVYVDPFADEKCVDDATMTGFRNFVLNGDTLAARGYRGRRVESSLEYRFRGEISARHPEASLDVIADPNLAGKVELAVSADGDHWLTTTSGPAGGTQRLKLSSAAHAEFASLREFRVRIRITGESSRDGSPAVRIDNLRIESDLAPAAERRVALRPAGESRTRLQFVEEFLSQKYRWLASITNEPHVEWSKGQIGVRMRPNGSQGALVWKVVHSEPLRNVRVRVDGRANAIHLATNHFLDVSTDGVHWRHEANTTGKEGDVNGWVEEALVADTANDPEFQGVREFYVRIRLQAASYEKEHPVLSGVVNRVLIEAETADAKE